MIINITINKHSLVMFIVIILFLMSCTKEVKVTEPPPPVDEGITRTFRVDNDCSTGMRASQTHADEYCIDRGFEYALRYSQVYGTCDIYVEAYWLEQVVCWKR